jgi:hypothetical protein
MRAVAALLWVDNSRFGARLEQLRQGLVRRGADAASLRAMALMAVPGSRENGIVSEGANWL